MLEREGPFEIRESQPPVGVVVVVGVTSGTQKVVPSVLFSPRSVPKLRPSSLGFD